MSKDKVYTQEEIDDLVKEHKIYPYTITDLDDYNRVAKVMDETQNSKDIIESLWFRELFNSVMNYEFTHLDEFDITEEEKDDEENPIYHLGQKVKFDYYKGNNVEQKEQTEK